MNGCCRYCQIARPAGSQSRESTRSQVAISETAASTSADRKLVSATIESLTGDAQERTSWYALARRGNGFRNLEGPTSRPAFDQADDRAVRTDTHISG